MFVHHGECPLCKAPTATHSPWTGSQHPPVYYSCKCFPNMPQLPVNKDDLLPARIDDGHHGDMRSLLGKRSSAVATALHFELIAIAHCQDEAMALQDDFDRVTREYQQARYAKKRDLNVIWQTEINFQLMTVLLDMLKKMRGET